MTKKELLQVMDTNEQYIVGLEADNETLKIGLTNKELDVGHKTADLKAQVNRAGSTIASLRNQKEALERKCSQYQDYIQEIEDAHEMDDNWEEVRAEMVKQAALDREKLTRAHAGVRKLKVLLDKALETILFMSIDE
jgi:phage shock protein A